MASEYNHTDIAVNDVNPKFINGFDIFLRTRYKVSNNYAMKMIQRFRTIYQVAIDNGWANKNPSSSFKLRFENTERGYLTMEELTFLMNKKTLIFILTVKYVQKNF